MCPLTLLLFRHSNRAHCVPPNLLCYSELLVSVRHLIPYNLLFTRCILLTLLLCSCFRSFCSVSLSCLFFVCLHVRLTARRSVCRLFDILCRYSIRFPLCFFIFPVSWIYHFVPRLVPLEICCHFGLVLPLLSCVR